MQRVYAWHERSPMEYGAQSNVRDNGPVATTVPTAILPRWEWRTFARTLHARDDILAHAVSDAEPERAEIYFLSAQSDQNVKVRNDKLEIKRLESVDASGLQLWRPTLAAPFPVDASLLVAAFDAWAVAAPSCRRDRYSLEQFTQEIVLPNQDLRVVRITKRRTRVSTNGCGGEYVALTVANAATDAEESAMWESAAFEDLDPARINAALDRLGLRTLDNTSYPAGLKRIVNFGSAGSLRSKETP